MTPPPLTDSRSPAQRAVELDATAAEIDRMSMADRLEFVRALHGGPASLLGADDSWRNVEALIGFLRDRGMAAPGSWMSYVNAGVLEGIERGIAIALGRSTDTFGNPAAPQWAHYLARLHRQQLATKGLHDRAWSRAKDASTDYGVRLAERVHGRRPTEVERRFLRLARLYNWALRNRPMADRLVGYGRLMDSRFGSLQPAFLDWLTDVTDPIAAGAACKTAYALAHIEALPGIGHTLGAVPGGARDLLAAQLSELLELYRTSG